MRESTWRDSCSMPASATRIRLPSNTHFLGHFSHYGGGPGTGAPAHAGSDEHHIGALQGLTNGLAMLKGRRMTGLWLGASAQTGATQLNLGACGAAGKRLRIGVGDDELNAIDTVTNHVLDRVATRAAHTHYLDDRASGRVIDDFKLHENLLLRD